VVDTARTRSILTRYPRATVVPVERYSEVFNRTRQSFRLQKRRPSLILARKQGNLVMEAPYGIGGQHNFYFSHVLNCLYDCRYCFLQGMFRSAHYVVFVNYEEFREAIQDTAASWPEDDVYFFSGYDGDSLALDRITGFLDSFLTFFASRPRLVLELRTKSVAIRPLLRREPFENCIVAFSFTPEEIRSLLEEGVPKVADRVAAMRRLAERGWRLGLRFDPLVLYPRYRDGYRELFEDVLDAVPQRAIHSVGLGAFRLPKDFYERMVRLYPEERLFAGPLEERAGMVTYASGLEEELRGYCRGELERRVPASMLFEY
ncbi:MAG TPA: DNA photolyase, partial [Vicinamibacteria bacterium]|nr:DNA photolyase [Vicinamibacteria bacterium]